MKTKSIFYSAMLVFSALTVRAQNTFPIPTGNVGIDALTPLNYNLTIGTNGANSVTTPTVKLQINEHNPFIELNDNTTSGGPMTMAQCGIRFTTSLNNTFELKSFSNAVLTQQGLGLFNNAQNFGLTFFQNRKMYIGSVGTSGAPLVGNFGDVNIVGNGSATRFTIVNNNLSYPVLNSNFAFGVYGKSLFTDQVVIGNLPNGTPGFDLSTNKVVLGTQSTVTDGYIEVNGSGGWAYNIKSNSNQPLASGTPTKLFCGFNSYDNKEVFVVQSNGNVKIGPKNYTGSAHSDYRLSVDGKVIAPSFYALDPTINWADYVFNKDYKLASLEEVEKFISINKHLPEVPSTQEVQANGINLQDMDAILLKKVEELTLYMIEMKKEMNSLKQENTELKNVVLELSK